jgi:predicted ester cyclase
MLRRFAIPLLLAGFSLTSAFAQEIDPVAANKALVKRYITEVLSANRMDSLDELLAPDFVDNTPGLASGEKGASVIRNAQERIRAIFPTVEYSIDDLIGEGDKVVARYTVKAATKEGQAVSITGMTIFRVSGGKIRETWIINDQVELYRQLGFTIEPPPEKPPASK